MNTFKKSAKLLAIVLLSIIVLVVLLFTINLIFTRLELDKRISMQKDHILNLKQIYNSDGYTPFDEQSIANFDLNNASEYSFVDTRYIGTHNSYKAKSTGYCAFANNVVEFVTNDSPIAYSYYFSSLTDQLNSGIRSLELDFLPHYNGFFECTHHAYMDTASNSPDLKLAFREIAMWSENNPNHLPITILLESKKWYIPLLGKNPTEKSLKELDNIIKLELKDSLMTPSDMLNGYSNFEEMRNADAYPTLDKMLGKVIVILHPSNISQVYYDMHKDTNLENSAMFLAESNNDLSRYSCFALCNDPTNTKEMNRLYEENYFIRTRIDSYPHYSEENHNSAINSPANILSTDYPIRDYRLDDGYILEGIIGNYYSTLRNSSVYKIL